MNSQDIVSIVAILYCIANLGSMGLELSLDKALASLRSVRLITLCLVWSWIIGPAAAVAVTRILPLTEAHAIGMIILGLSPTAPLLPILIRKAQGDMDVAAALAALAVIGTVIFMPIIAPLLIPSASISTMLLAKQLALTVLAPLVAGVLIQQYASNFAATIFPYVKRVASLTTLGLLAATVIYYGREFVEILGSFAVAALVLWTVVIGFASYALGFGMNQAQRSALSLGVSSRNGGITLVAFATFPVQDPDVLVMLLLSVPVPIVVWLLMARFFSSRAAKPSPVS